MGQGFAAILLVQMLIVKLLRGSMDGFPKRVFEGLRIKYVRTLPAESRLIGVDQRCIHELLAGDRPNNGRVSIVSPCTSLNLDVVYDCLLRLREFFVWAAVAFLGERTDSCRPATICESMPEVQGMCSSTRSMIPVRGRCWDPRR